MFVDSSPVEVAIGIVIGDRCVRIQGKGFSRPETRGIENAAVFPDIVAEHNEGIDSRFQCMRRKKMLPFDGPVIFRIGPCGDFSEEFSIQPDPGFVIDCAEEEFRLLFRQCRRDAERIAVPEPAVVFFQFFELGLERAGDPDRAPVLCPEGGAG